MLWELWLSLYLLQPSLLYYCSTAVVQDHLDIILCCIVRFMCILKVFCIMVHDMYLSSCSAGACFDCMQLISLLTIVN